MGVILRNDDRVGLRYFSVAVTRFVVDIVCVVAVVLLLSVVVGMVVDDRFWVELLVEGGTR